MSAAKPAPLSIDPVVNDILKRGVDQAEQGHPPEDRRRLSDLVRAYFAHVDPADLVGSDPADLVGMVTSHRRLALQRGRCHQDRGLHPTIARNGWSCGHTVLQVVTDDMPFLVDSISLSLTRADHDLHLVIHPQLVVTRDDAGALIDVVGLFSDHPRDSWPDGALVEAWIAVEINRVSDDAELERIEERAQAALTDVSAAVQDWPQMHELVLVSPPNCAPTRRVRWMLTRCRSPPTSSTGWRRTTSPSSVIASTTCPPTAIS